MSLYLKTTMRVLTPQNVYYVSMSFYVQKSDQTLGEVMVIFPITMAMLGCPLFMGLIPVPLFSNSVQHFFSKNQ